MGQGEEDLQLRALAEPSRRVLGHPGSDGKDRQDPGGQGG